MQRTVELVRAVISATEASLELWLTTYITLSPKQHCLDIEQLSAPALLNFLKSGEVWVYGTERMHLVLDISLRGEPMDLYDTKALAAAIVDAPAWCQLKLSPSLPVEYGQISNQSIHINLDRSPNDVEERAKKCHRITAKVVPDGIATLALHSIRFHLVILENMSKGSGQRQQKPNPKSTPTLFQGMTDAEHENNDLTPVLSEELLDVRDDSNEEILFTTSSPAPMPRPRKRKRSVSLPDVHVEGLADMPCNIRRHDTYDTPLSLCDTPERSESRLLSHMVDAAVRFSAFTSLKGATGGLKVKANAFPTRLADIAPVVWRPGFLSALSQRACLAPTLNSSLNRIISKAKTSHLQAPSTNFYVNLPADEPPYAIKTTYAATNDIDSRDSKSTWIYTHKTLLSRPASGSLQPFCSVLPSG
ncbi:unnamed protein product [Periconia digitata]|uniref:Uncharacterized protein n=1 Tax=Periconia digitata TaxID=1303443 RepID=A0A9W4XUK8_9PLEO|nr:unnamed protein product [Periconia digitata]